MEKEQPGILADEASGWSECIRTLLRDLREEWQRLDERITASDTEVHLLGPYRRGVPSADLGARHLRHQRDGTGGAFARGRDMTAWLGPVSRQMTTGGKPRRLGISKRGNRHLRRNLIHRIATCILKFVKNIDFVLMGNQCIDLGCGVCHEK
ncbi:transposase [Magnetospirillum sp. XM-1]|uniref:transposase n=1 Tax=Magnetospirillum sp. XM-1 TaxID=1663591 RepID=UPI001560F1FB|nr:transposase [Magnetospirillum sp. XM-1]